jgi:hypothetical protein
MAGLFAKKPLERLMTEAQEVGEHCLKRSLGPVNLVMLGIGAIIGAGLFVRTAAAIAIVRVLPWCSPSLSQEWAAHLPACVMPSLRR